MGEVVVSNEGGTGLEIQETEQPKINNEGGGDMAAVMWERFLPKMVLRVLLVESDVSTRQIIAALLRKCNYRVAAVSDGLKAWELLKGRPHNIDLILTEVDLPSISGYALLSLIMEHEVCKNIPVIMMSTNDSVSTVYKCMLKGASDFLVKPLRKNELKNLWQHVWRKQASSSATGPGPPDETGAQQKVEATADNAVSNHSSGYIASLQRNREYIEKGSDAQSSCTKPDAETEGMNTKHVHCPSQPKSDKCIPSNTPMQMECRQESRKTDANDDEAGESQVAASLHANYPTEQGQGKNSVIGWEQVNVHGQNSGINPSKEAIDFIGAFDSYLKGTFATNSSTNKLDVLPTLDLSLKRSHPSGSSNQGNDEAHRLNHSGASAFSRYINQPFHVSSSPSTCNHHKDPETNSEKQFSNHTPDYTSDTHGQTIAHQNHHVSVATNHPGPSEISLPYSQQREISLPIPVRGVRFDINAYGSVIPQMYCTPSGVSPLTSPAMAQQSESITQLYQFHNCMDQRTSNAADQADNKQAQNLEGRGNVSPPLNNQSGNSSFCNASQGHHHVTGSGNNGKINSVSVVNVTSDGGNEEALPAHEGGASHRSLLREAALQKFRMKRKDRCFDKKVRYESRKKLAEQRPRVKGQFVRQLPNDPQSGNSSVS